MLPKTTPFFSKVDMAYIYQITSQSLSSYGCTITVLYRQNTNHQIIRQVCCILFLDTCANTCIVAAAQTHTDTGARCLPVEYTDNMHCGTVYVGMVNYGDGLIQQMYCLVLRGHTLLMKAPGMHLSAMFHSRETTTIVPRTVPL